MKGYDFGLAWSGTIREGFVKMLQNACKNTKLSFLWVSQDNIKEVLKRLQANQLSIKVLLDTEATYNDPKDLYARLCYAVKDSGGVVINDPDRTKLAIDKSVMHYELLNAGIGVPYSVVVRNWEPNDFRLTEQERQKLGAPFIIKPALGYGQQGVVRNAKGSIREIAKARDFDKGDNFLLQEKIIPIELIGRRAWFRVLHVFDTIIPCWWDDEKNMYEHIEYEEFNTYRLFPLAKITAKIAAITKMAWFSTEIAIDKKFGKNRFLTIDYVNDQCDMSVKSETINGIPDDIVKLNADCIIDLAYKCINKQKISRKYNIYLKDANIEIKGLGNAPSIMHDMIHHPHFF